MSREIFQMHFEKEPCCCELKYDSGCHDSVKGCIPFWVTRNTYCGIFTTCKNCWATETSKHGTLRSDSRSGVFSMPCWAVLCRAVLSRTVLLLCNAVINTSLQQLINMQQYRTLCFPIVSSTDVTQQWLGGHVICVYSLLVDVCPSAV
jgi:hypothetical protein